VYDEYIVSHRQRCHSKRRGRFSARRQNGHFNCYFTCKLINERAQPSVLLSVTRSDREPRTAPTIQYYSRSHGALTRGPGYRSARLVRPTAHGARTAAEPSRAEPRSDRNQIDVAFAQPARDAADRRIFWLSRR